MICWNTVSAFDHSVTHRANLLCDRALAASCNERYLLTGNCHEETRETKETSLYATSLVANVADDKAHAKIGNNCQVWKTSTSEQAALKHSLADSKRSRRWHSTSWVPDCRSHQTNNGKSADAKLSSVTSNEWEVFWRMIKLCAESYESYEPQEIENENSNWPAQTKWNDHAITTGCGWWKKQRGRIETPLVENMCDMPDISSNARTLWF